MVAILDWQHPVATDPTTTSPDGRDHDTHHADIIDAVQDHERALIGPIANNPLAYSSRSESLLLDPEATTNWVALGAATLTTDATNFTLGTKSVSIGNLGITWDTNPELLDGAYVNLQPSDHLRGEWSHVALDLRWTFGSGTFNYTPGEFFELVVAETTDLDGDLVTARIPTFLLATWKTLFIPVRDLTKIRSLGIRTRTDWSPGFVLEESNVKMSFRVDNIRWAEQSQLERALENVPVAIVPPSYVPSVTQKILDVPTNRSIIDLRSGGVIIANGGGIQHVGQFQAIPADGTTDARAQLSDLSALIPSHSKLVFPPNGVYKIGGLTGSVDLQSLDDVEIDCNGATFYTDVDRTKPFFILNYCRNLKFRNFKIFGSRPITENGSAFTNEIGTPTINGTTKELNAQLERVRITCDVPLARDKDFEAKIDFVLSDSAQVTDDCLIEVVDADAPDTAPTAVAAGTGGAVAVGTSFIAYTDIDAEHNETTLSPSVSITLATADQVDVTLPALPDRTPPVIERVIYMTSPGAIDAPGNYHIVARIYDTSVLAWRVNFSEAAAPAWTTAVLADIGVGNVEQGEHVYGFSNYNSTTKVESPVGPMTGAGGIAAATIDLTRNAQVSISGIPLGPVGTTHRYIYRTPAGVTSTQSSRKRVGSIANNTGTTFTDNIADASLGDRGPDTTRNFSNIPPYWPRKVLTLTATPTTYRLVIPSALAFSGRRFRIRISKLTATANTITCTSATTYGRIQYVGTPEGCHGVQVAYGCENVTIEDGLVEGVGGDGVWAGRVSSGYTNIRRVISRGARRQGMSAINGESVLIEDCEIREPAHNCVDFEPESEDVRLWKVTLRRVDFYNAPINAVNGGASRVRKIDILDCRAMGRLDNFFGGQGDMMTVWNLIAPWAQLSLNSRRYTIGPVSVRGLNMPNGHFGSFDGWNTGEAGSAVIGPVLFSSEAAADAIDTDVDVPIGMSMNLALAQPAVETTPTTLVAGVPSDADFPYVPPNGTKAINTLTDTEYYRKAGVWTVLT